ncbi:MAG: TolC family protein [Chlamydiae bacterium]|nr:TolC family protein [Chlamydiota bacterium]MBI3265887.1 TolC family protein [Chlamydiota bacterium]
MKTLSFLFLFFTTLYSGFAQEAELSKLSIQDAVDQAIESNFDLKIERFNPEIAAWDITQKEGVFDPVASSFLKYKDEKKPLTQQYSIAAGGLEETEVRDFSLSNELSGKIPTGTEYVFDFTSLRDSSTFNLFRPEYSQSLSGTLRQPLLKDFGTGANMAWIRISKNQHLSSKLQLEETMSNIISQVESIYWDLIFTLQDLEVKKESLKLAESLLEQNQIREKLGTISPLEVIQSEAGVATRKEALLVSEQQIREKENQLKRLILKDMQGHLSTQMVPSDLPSPSYQDRTAEERIRLALENRKDLQRLKLELVNQNILLKYYQNQRLPRLDLEGTLGWNGLNGGFANAFEDLDGGDHPLWSVGIAFKYPIGDRSNQALYQKSKLEQKKGVLQLKKLEDDIIIQVDTQTSQVKMLWKKIQASELSQHFAEESLRAEQKKYEVGTSTSHNVLDFEEDLAIAKSNKLKSQIDYLKAVIELEKLQGTTLKSRKIKIQF